MAAEFLGLEGQVVRVHADAVPADQPRTERQEVPLGPGRFQHIQRINAEPVKDDGQLIHQRDVQVALRVLDDLGGFRNLDAGGTVDARAHDRPVQLRQQIQRRASLPETIFLMVSSVCTLSPGLIRSGE